MPKLIHVVGARPNFMKIGPLLSALEERGRSENVLVHTGQHYDHGMSASFFEDLGIRDPDVHLGVGSGTHGKQTAAILAAMEDVLLEEEPDGLVVVGDVNSTVAAALAAAKLGVKIAHVEAGLRSRDRRMPEEINRILTDQLSDLCLTPSRDGDENLAAEGIPPERIARVGNIMIDSLHRVLPRAEAAGAPGRHGVEGEPYAVVTLHRPSNVDDRDTLAGLLAALDTIAEDRPVLFPIHPRTAARLDEFGLRAERVRVLEPIGYVEMVSLVRSAAMVLTDSGGIQEETTALGVPCLTLRSSTERPVTVDEGTNTLVPDRSTEAVLAAYRQARSMDVTGRVPDLWDGETAGRIADLLERW